MSASTTCCMPGRADGSYTPHPDLLADRVLFVTGAGDGSVPRLAYARLGADVALLGRTQAKLEAVFRQHCIGNPDTPGARAGRPRTRQRRRGGYPVPRAAPRVRSPGRHSPQCRRVLHNAGALGRVHRSPSTRSRNVMYVNVNAAFVVTRADAAARGVSGRIGGFSPLPARVVAGGLVGRVRGVEIRRRGPRGSARRRDIRERSQES